MDELRAFDCRLIPGLQKYPVYRMMLLMDSLQLRQYIAESLAHGSTNEQIINALQQAGWPAEAISQAFAREQAVLVPPAPMPETVQHSQAGAQSAENWLKTPLVKDLLIAFVFAVVMGITFRLLLPSPEDQAIYGFDASLSGSILPAGIFPVMITTIVVGAIYALILKFALKYKDIFGIILAALAGDFLALIAEQDRIIGWGFILGLLLTYPLAQLAAHYANKRMLRIAYVIVTFVLMVLSIRVLNVGHF